MHLNLKAFVLVESILFNLFILFLDSYQSVYILVMTRNLNQKEKKKNIFIYILFILMSFFII